MKIKDSKNFVKVYRERICVCGEDEKKKEGKEFENFHFQLRATRDENQQFSKYLYSETAPRASISRSRDLTTKILRTKTGFTLDLVGKMEDARRRKKKLKWITLKFQDRLV